MDNIAPPVQAIPAFVLRPHHVSLVALLVLAFTKTEKTPPKSHSLLLHIMRVVSKEIAELSRKPILQKALLLKLTAGGTTKETVVERADFSQRVEGISFVVNTIEELDDLFRDASRLVADRDEDGAPPAQTTQPLERRSFLGMFVRKCCLGYRKLSYLASSKLHANWVAWCGDDSEAGYDLKKDERGGGLLVWSAVSDEQTWAQVDPYDRYATAMENGDPQIAVDNLRRYFDQRFSLAGDSPFLQHALLQLALLHYQNDGVAAAKEALDEAIKVARERSDKSVLDACTSLTARLYPKGSLLHDGSTLIQPGHSPIDILWDAARLIGTAEPLSVAFQRVYESMGCQDASASYNDAEVNWARHSVQAALWTLAGVKSLAKTHQNIVISFSDSNSSDARLPAICNAATLLSREGKRDEALAVLLDPETWRGLSAAQYTAWISHVHQRVGFSATRKGQDGALHTFLLSRIPFPSRNVDDVTLRLPTSKSWPWALNRVISLKPPNRSSQSINLLMESLWSTEFRGLFLPYRLAILLLADLGLELGMARSGRKAIEDCLPQILNGDDLEQRAFACLVLAKCMIAEGTEKNEVDSSDSPLRSSLLSAIPFLTMSSQDYATIDMYEAQEEALYLLAVVYHNLGMYPDRDRAAELHRKVENKRRSGIENALRNNDVEREVLKAAADISELVLGDA